MSELLLRQKGRLRLMILWLLYQSPRRGIDIIDDIYKMTWGWWRPSPGSVYPLLNKMVEDGVVVKGEEDKYVITQKGIKELESIFPLNRRSNIEDAIEELEGLANFFNEAPREQVIQFKERIMSALNKIRKVVENA
ncbi:MAG: PadR family transcriptional regulator [Sulfolobus sp.]|jgi:DNA-binding PadR family transcriptional regulator|nr:PadR family transcriptional regulator [Sulfolobaceae archaeon]